MPDYERDTYGLSGAGPLTVTATAEQPNAVHIGWPTEHAGMWLDRRQLRQLVDAIDAAAAAAGMSPLH
jgi:hypothetical protein